MSYFKVFIYALLTAPLILFNVSHASTYTTGDLLYDDGTKVITNTNTGLSYLGWDVLSSYTYQETVDATASSGAYSDYHIADFDEAKTFYKAATYGPCAIVLGVNYHCKTEHIFGANGWFGANFTSAQDKVWFQYDADNAGSIVMGINSTSHTFRSHNSYIPHGTDVYSAGGTSAHIPITWLLVANTTSPVPVPAAIWLFGTALIGLVGYGKRKSKVPV